MCQQLRSSFCSFVFYAAFCFLAGPAQELNEPLQVLLGTACVCLYYARFPLVMSGVYIVFACLGLTVVDVFARPVVFSRVLRAESLGGGGELRFCVV